MDYWKVDAFCWCERLPPCVPLRIPKEIYHWDDSSMSWMTNLSNNKVAVFVVTTQPSAIYILTEYVFILSTFVIFIWNYEWLDHAILASI